MHPIWKFESDLIKRLLIWSSVSLLFGLYACFFTTGFWFGFGIQCIAWGLVDAIIAIVGKKNVDRKQSTTSAEGEAAFIKKVLWINFGLDVLYIIGGVYVIQNYGDVIWQGTGWGIVLQGVFLFLFDFFHAIGVPDESFLSKSKM